MDELHGHSCYPSFKPELQHVFKQLLRSSRLGLKELRMRLGVDYNSAADYFTSMERPTVVSVKYFYVVTSGTPQEWVRIIGG